MRFSKQGLGILLAAPVLALAGGAQSAPGDQANPTDKFKSLEFREIGPAIMGGRIDDFAVVEKNPSIVYVGTASGGVWKTTNNGTTWEPVFDKESVSTIGDIAVAPSDPSMVWVGTGEPNNRQSSSWGDGIYKSMDSGKTWKKMGLEATRHIGRVVIHPKNPDLVYVAALGHLWGPNPERGVYKTTDGGKNWTQVLKINDDTGVSDLAMDPESPDTLYAAAYQRRRTPFGFNGGGLDGAIYKTTDGGASWKKLTKGLPYENGGEVGRIGLDIYQKNSSIVYALVQSEKGGLYRSEDKGETWKKMSDTDPRPSYYSQVRIDPNNDLRIWVLGAPMYYSEDGGKSFITQRIRGIHGDYHAFWIDPADSSHLIAGTDGGIHWSYDGGKSWDFLNNIAIGQFYELSVDNEKPYHICGGLQDNASWCGPSATLARDGIRNWDWSLMPGGDGFYAAIDNVEPWIIYTESQDGHLSRLDTRTHQMREIMPRAKMSEPHYRFQWNSPVAISAFDHQTVYYGGNHLFKSTTRGDRWELLGPDLTSGVDRNKLAIFGKVPDKSSLSRHDGVEEYPTITTLSESPLSANILWVGTDDGCLQVSRDGGKSWKNVASKVPGVPKGTYVSRVVASRASEGSALVAFDGHRSDDTGVYLFSTGDYGESWKAIRNGIPDTTGTLHVIREHPKNTNLLFAGTEFGLWISWNRGADWTALKNNLPTVPVDDIQIQERENDLVLATHGRSIWILDDLTPIEKMDPATAAPELTLFPLRSATAWHLARRQWFSGQKTFTGKNPPYGAVINYFLKSAVPPEAPKKEAAETAKNDTADNRAKPGAEKKEGKVKITVLDHDGKTVREQEGPGAAGVNRTNWDLRWNSPAESTPEQEEAAAAGFDFRPHGPLAEPGEYTIQIKAGEQRASQKVIVEEDSRVHLSASERVLRWEAIEKVYAMSKIMDKDRKSIQGIQTALKTAREGWKKEGGKIGETKIPPELMAVAEALQTKVDAVAERFVRDESGLGNAGPAFEWKPEPLPGQVGGLLAELDDLSSLPSPSQLDWMAELTPLVAEASGQVKKIAEEELPALNKKMNDAGMPHIVPAKPQPRGGRGGSAEDEF